MPIVALRCAAEPRDRAALKWFAEWRRARILRRSVLDQALWLRILDRYAFLHALAEDERHRLREQVMLFLHDKSIHGAGGLEMRDEIRYTIAAQACILTLNLGPDCYRGWVEVIVYPDEFVASYEFVDEDGVAHQVEEPMSGESWLQGPVILSWADAQDAGCGSYNVVIHEFAHKLDMLNGEANGFPPLHADMSREAWSSAFERAYGDFCARVDRDDPVPVDDYAAEDPAEFFAVLSEAFFQAPDAIRIAYPDVYRQLALYYRQDPAARLGAANRQPRSLVTA